MVLVRPTLDNCIHLLDCVVHCLRLRGGTLSELFRRGLNVHQEEVHLEASGDAKLAQI